MGRIEEIKAREQAATPGPWKVNETTVMQCDTFCVVKNMIVDSSDKGIGAYDYNTEFIAHAREDVPYLVAKCEQLTAKLEKYYEAEQDGRLIILPEKIVARESLNGWVISTVDFGCEFKRIEVVTLVREDYVPKYLEEQAEAEQQAP